VLKLPHGGRNLNRRACIAINLAPEKPVLTGQCATTRLPRRLSRKQMRPRKASSHHRAALIATPSHFRGGNRVKIELLHFSAVVPIL